MSNHLRMRVQHFHRLITVGRRRAIPAVTRLTSRTGCEYRVPIEVLITGFWCRHSIRVRVRRVTRKLERILSSPLPLDVAVIVQQAIMTERQLPGCYQISQRPDGSQFALIRLALEVDGRRLTTDELLAVLAEQYITLTMRQNGPSLLVPIDLVSPRPDDARRPAVFRSDPLRPRRDVDDHGA
jgi:hypothetical protein